MIDHIIEEKIIRNIRIIQKIYFAFLVLGVFSLIYLASGISDIRGRDSIPEFLILTLLVSAKYYGLRLKRRWVIPLILYSSALALISLILGGLVTTQNVPMGILSIALSSMLFGFYAYQVYFFSRRDVNLHFGKEGKIIF